MKTAAIVWLLATATLGMLLAPRSALADEVEIQGCVLERAPTALLLKSFDDTLVELDLSRVVNTSPYNPRQDDCLRFTGFSLGTNPPQPRSYPQAGWVLQVFTIDALKEGPKRVEEEEQKDERIEKLPSH